MVLPERTDKGQVRKGHKNVSPGRPPREVEEEYRNILVSSVTQQDWQEIIFRAVKDAKRGDHQARKFLADYLIGPPVERKEITGLEGAPIEFIEIIRDATPDIRADNESE
jgi:hypothetical protein